ncbi:NUDIX domain-containing protein [Candidatus Daviesbacteria bacterium]|nr:NUDIX domain-containing protein [Candidatus Daviesbacteria bacterium]
MGDLYKTFGIATKAIIYSKGKYLLLFKSDQEEISPNSYDFPGGRLGFREKPEEAVVREVFEETNLRVKSVGVFNIWTFTKKNFQLVGVDFFCKFTGGKEKLSKEHQNSWWLSKTQILSNKNIPDWVKQTIKKAEQFRTLNKIS